MVGKRGFKKLCGYEWTNKTEVCNRVHIPGTDSNDVVIGYGDIELFLRFNRWLKYHKLHKYSYFFANLCYSEIQTICDEDSITLLEQKVDLHWMTDGARKSIIRKLVELNQREARLMVFSKISYYSSVSKVERAIFELKEILKTPIRTNSAIPFLLVRAMETAVHAALKLPRKDFMQVHQSAMVLLKLAWGSYFFQVAVKNKFNSLQYFLNSKKMSFSYSRPKNIHLDRDVYAIHFDVEIGIKTITAYLEQFILQDDD